MHPLVQTLNGTLRRVPVWPGYVLGFVPAAWFVGWLLPKARTYPARLGVFLAASLFILLPGYFLFK